MGPFIPQEIIGSEWNLVIAFIVGIGFGFSLEQAGFSSSQKMVGIFYGRNFVVLKVFLTAVLTAVIGLFIFDYVDLIDLQLVYINPTYLGAGIIGGMITGLGIILSGFCPGTSFAAASIGKIDAMVFIGGIFLGVLIFGEAFPLIEEFYYGSNLGKLMVFDSLGISRELFIFLLVVAGIAMFFAAGIIQKKVLGSLSK